MRHYQKTRKDTVRIDDYQAMQAQRDKAVDRFNSLACAVMCDQSYHDRYREMGEQLENLTAMLPRVCELLELVKYDSKVSDKWTREDQNTFNCLVMYVPL